MDAPPPGKCLNLDFTLAADSDLADRLARISRGNDLIADFLRRNTALDEKDLFAFNLAYEELASNVARYAVTEDGRTVRLHVKLEATPSSVSLFLSDDGPAFNLLTASTTPKPPGAEGGLGLKLIRRYFPSIRYWYENSRNSVHIEKSLENT